LFSLLSLHFQFQLQRSIILHYIHSTIVCTDSYSTVRQNLFILFLSQKSRMSSLCSIKDKQDVDHFNWFHCLCSLHKAHKMCLGFVCGLCSWSACINKDSYKLRSVISKKLFFHSVFAYSTILIFTCIIRFIYNYYLHYKGAFFKIMAL